MARSMDGRLLTYAKLTCKPPAGTVAEPDRGEP